PWLDPAREVYGTILAIVNTFWSTSGIYNNVGFSFPRGTHVAFLAILLSVWCLLACDRRVALRRDVFIASVLTVLVNATLVVRFGVLYGQGQGRFMFPSLI